MSLQSQELQLQSVLRNFVQNGVVLAVTSNPFAWSPQLKLPEANDFFQQIWTLKQLWTAFSFSLAETAISFAVSLAYSEAEQLSGIIQV